MEETTIVDFQLYIGQRVSCMADLFPTILWTISEIRSAVTHYFSNYSPDKIAYVT